MYLNKMKWLIYGSKGWIGGMVINYIKNNFPEEVIYDGTSRVDNENEVEEELKSIKPNRVLSFIGRTHGPGYSTIDYLEQKGKLVENIRDNLYSPVVLSLLCKKYDIHFTYMGTGCIFTYSEEKDIFDEEDKPNFFGSSYSIVKGFTDRLMHFFNDSVLNVRIRMPIVGHHHPRNFITKIVNYEKICSIENSMTVLDDLIPILIDMIMNKVTGTINLTNPGVISHNEILEMYKKYVDPKKKWVNFSIDDQSKILLSARSNNELDVTKLQDMYPYPYVLNIKESIERLFRNWNQL
jgi:nucleoside-diphosphate-sugar epimerase